MLRSTASSASSTCLARRAAARCVLPVHGVDSGSFDAHIIRLQNFFAGRQILRRAYPCRPSRAVEPPWLLLACTLIGAFSGLSVTPAAATTSQREARTRRPRSRAGEHRAGPDRGRHRHVEADQKATEAELAGLRSAVQETAVRSYIHAGGSDSAIPPRRRPECGGARTRTPGSSRWDRSTRSIGTEPSRRPRLGCCAAGRPQGRAGRAWSS
jgi:hypothetical protein